MYHILERIYRFIVYFQNAGVVILTDGVVVKNNEDGKIFKHSLFIVCLIYYFAMPNYCLCERTY